MDTQNFFDIDNKANIQYFLFFIFKKTYSAADIKINNLATQMARLSIHVG
jgi:hypothetical protein